MSKIKSASRDKVVFKDGTTLFHPGRNLLDDLYASYAEFLSTGDVTNDSHLGKMIRSEFKQLDKNVKEDKVSALSVIRELGKVVKSTQSYYDEKNKGDTDFCHYLIQKGLFPWQKKVLECPSKKTCLICGRRAGKTYALAKIAVDKCVKGKDRVENDGVVVDKPVQVIIIGLTITKCADLYWENIKTAAVESKLPINHIDNGSFTLEFANGASIQLAGVASKAEIEKIRGADFSVAILDECQSIKGLRNLVVNVLGPILKGRNGTILFAGTAPLSAATYWEEIINDESITHFRATMEDNPSIPNYQHALEDVLKENNWDENNITFKREYLAEIVYDYDLIVYGRRAYRNKDEDLSTFTHCTIGADWGWSDATALEAVLYNDEGDMREVLTWNKSQADVSEILSHAFEMVNVIEKEYHIPRSNIKIVADSSNGNVNAELYNKGLTMLENAYKFDKLFQIKILRESLASRQLLLNQGDPFDIEADKIVWKQDEENGHIIYEIDDKVFHGNSCDALRYAVNTIITDLGLYNQD